MRLESATFINDLVASNPLGSDFKNPGDNHLRLIKQVLKNTFPGLAKAISFPSSVASQTGTVTITSSDGGKIYPVNADAGAITVNLPATAGLPDGFEVRVVKTDFTANVVTIDGSGSDTINGNLTISLWQAYQTAKLTWCSLISAWLG